MAHGIVFPQDNLSEYQKKEKTPIGELKYWSELLLRQDGEKFLQNAIKFKEISESIATSKMAMHIIMEGIKLYD